MDVFSGILMISMNDRVCAGFAQCDLNVALALRNAAALPDQEHELIHERKNRSHFAWQRALQFDARAALIMGYSHSQTFFKVRTPPCNGLHLCEATIHKQFRSRDVAAVVGCEKNHRLGDLIGCTEPAERNVVGNHFLAFLAHFCGSEQVTQSGRVGAWAYRVYVNAALL